VKFSIGVRLFIAVLLSIIAVAALALLLMAEKVRDSFSDYATQIELHRLEEVSQSLLARYAEKENWSFLPGASQEKIEWVSAELLRLYQKNSKRGGYTTDQSRLPAKASEVSLPVEAAQPAPQVRIVVRVATTVDSMLPPLPPMPPLPPPPPSMVNQPDPLAEVARPAVDRAAVPGPQMSLPDLYRRITLLDQDHHYLAGRLLDTAANASRSIYFGDKLIGYLQVANSEHPTDALANAFLQKQTDIILIIIVLAIALSAVAATLLALHFRRPIHRLVEGSRMLADGNYSMRLAEQRSDELGELAHSFNQLADKLEQAEQTRRQWVADTSHELRTPISVLRAQLEAMQDGIRQASPENIALMLRQILAMNKLIDELYALARADLGELQYHMQSLDLWSLALDVAANFREKLAATQLRIDVAVTPKCSTIRGDTDRLHQVLSNLFENCIRYTTAGGCILLSLETQDGHLVLIVDDSAPGVPDDALERLGERFFRVDSSRNRQQGGSGLGLALCRRIMQAHHGKITFSHAPSGGLRVQLFFPSEPT
jgi:two-component system sensor histidine kinase BaeS